MTRPANSDNPRLSDPWLRPAAGKVAPPRSVPPVRVRVRENVLAPPLPAPAAQRATVTVPLPSIDRPLSEYCRSYRAPNKDLVPFPVSPSTARRRARSRPSVHTARRVPPCLLPTWHNPDSPDPTILDLLQIDRHECRLPPMPRAHSHIRDDPSPPTAPSQSRARGRRARCTP